jgi:hypothetical protein
MPKPVASRHSGRARFMGSDTWHADMEEEDAVKTHRHISKA